MVVRKKQARIGTKPEIGQQRRGVKHVVSAAAGLLADNHRDLVGFGSAGQAAELFPNPFVRPVMREVMALEQRTRTNDRIDVAAIGPGNPQYLRNRLLRKSPRALD